MAWRWDVFITTHSRVVLDPGLRRDDMLLLSKFHAAFSEIVRGHFYHHLIARKHTNAVLTHFS